MRDDQMKQYLDEIAQEDIGEHMDMWPELEQKLKAKRKRSYTSPLRLYARLAAALFVAAFAGVMGYALYQSTMMDTSIPEQDVIPLQINGEDRGVHVVLQWAYADEHRVTLHWTTEYRADQTHVSLQSTLKTADGTVLPAISGGGGGGGGSENTVIRTTSEASFDMTGIEAQETMEFLFTLEENQSMPAGGGGGGNGGSGGGGGGNTPSNVPTLVPTVSVPDKPISFNFQFALPVQPAEVIAVEALIAESDGITMLLPDIQVTPSMMTFELCSPLFLTDVDWPTEENAEETQFWQPVLIVWANNDNSTVASADATAPHTGYEGNGCYNMQARLDSTEANEFMLEIMFLKRSGRSLADVSAADVEAEEAFFAEMDIDVTFTDVSQYGYGSDIEGDDPGDMLPTQLVSALAFSERMAGIWAFQATR